MMASPEAASPTSNRAPFIIMGVGLVVGLLAGLLVFAGVPNWLTGQSPIGGGPTVTPAPAPVVGAPAPDFALTDLDGNEVRLSDLKGQVVLINFWATWCGPCVLEMPAIEAEYQARQAQGFTVLGVNSEYADMQPEVETFVADLDLSFTNLLDQDSEVYHLYRVRGMPTTYFIDREGNIARQVVGYMADGQLSTYLDQLGLGE